MVKFLLREFESYYFFHPISSCWVLCFFFIHGSDVFGVSGCGFPTSINKTLEFIWVCLGCGNWRFFKELTKDIINFYSVKRCIKINQNNLYSKYFSHCHYSIPCNIHILLHSLSGPHFMDTLIIGLDKSFSMHLFLPSCWFVPNHNSWVVAETIA